MPGTTAGVKWFGTFLLVHDAAPCAAELRIIESCWAVIHYEEINPNIAVDLPEYQNLLPANKP